MAEVHFPYPHDADPEVFREALAYSEATTGFTATLIEKDYYCSLVLQHFFDSDTSLVFRGGTSLSKVHADFYRLSEDLDFIIPVTVNSTRSQRRAEMEPVKLMFEVLPTAIPGMAIFEAIQGHNLHQ
jgi:predicted nucleotidyltransferase component of viral defense system